MAKLPKYADNYCFIFAKVKCDEPLKFSKNILVAPLNWGLGHATRCIPIITELELHGYNPILASDGMALELLKLEFPHLEALELPSYGIEYPKNGKYFRFKILLNLPHLLSAISQERTLVQKWQQQFNFSGIISDNRAGVYLKSVPSIYITHQIRVLSGITTFLSSFMHRRAIAKFDECWIPDFEDEANLSFELSHSSSKSIGKKFIGTLSRLNKVELPTIWDLLIILSGPEPQRGILEKILKNEIRCYTGKVLFIGGEVSGEQKTSVDQNITFYNFMTSQQLETAMNQSEIILCRSGYTSVMDLAHLQKKCFFIPTPGQFEQEYLAEKYQQYRFAPFSKQANFKVEDLEKVKDYIGLPKRNHSANWKQLFRLFDRK